MLHPPFLTFFKHPSYSVHCHILQKNIYRVKKSRSGDKKTVYISVYKCTQIHNYDHDDVKMSAAAPVFPSFLLCHFFLFLPLSNFFSLRNKRIKMKLWGFMQSSFSQEEKVVKKKKWKSHEKKGFEECKHLYFFLLATIMCTKIYMESVCRVLSFVHHVYVHINNNVLTFLLQVIWYIFGCLFLWVSKWRPLPLLLMQGTLFPKLSSSSSLNHPTTSPLTGFTFLSFNIDSYRTVLCTHIYDIIRLRYIVLVFCMYTLSLVYFYFTFFYDVMRISPFPLIIGNRASTGIHFLPAGK